MSNKLNTYYQKNLRRRNTDSKQPNSKICVVVAVLKISSPHRNCHELFHAKLIRKPRKRMSYTIFARRNKKRTAFRSRVAQIGLSLETLYFY